MKLTNLSKKLLKFMVSKYRQTDNDIFLFDDLKSEFPDFSNDFLSKALYLLQNKGYVSVCPGDNVAYVTTLLSDGISAIEEDTWFKKSLAFLKEIKTLLQ